MKKILYLGLEISEAWKKKHHDAKVMHCPIIRIQPLSLQCPEIMAAFSLLDEYTHIVMTSKVAVRLFFQALKHFQIEIRNKMFIAVGQATAKVIAEYGNEAAYTASEESSEGIVQMFQALNLSNAYLFWPCSALSRNIIPFYLERKCIRFCKKPLYLTVPNLNSLDVLNQHLHDADELVFTSPSSIDAFISFKKVLPKNKIIHAIGPITEAALFKLCPGLEHRDVRTISTKKA